MLQINNGVGLVFVNLGHELNHILEWSFLQTFQLHLHIFKTKDTKGKSFGEQINVLRPPNRF
jgi:hypothetical protein